MYRKQLSAALLLTALCVMLSLQLALASVGLVSFNAQATGNTILVTWVTATEQDTIGFKLYRSNMEFPSDWGTEIDSQPAQGGAQTGGNYQYEDTKNITAGVKYWYRLMEVTSSGSLAEAGKTSGGINLATNTPTATPTSGPTPTPTRTATPQPTSAPYSTATFTVVVPTATPKYTIGPATTTPNTPTRTPPATLTPLRPPTSTPLPPARVASPTGPAPMVTMPPAPAPTFTVVVVAQVTAAMPDTPTPELIATEEGPKETATPLPTKDVTPIIFSAEAQGRSSPTPQSTAEVAEQGNSSLALIIGGSAVGLAALLAAVLLFLRSRRA